MADDLHARLAALLDHPDLAVVRQGVELHRSLCGELPVRQWRTWQSRELYAWLRQQSRTPDPAHPLRLEVRTPRALSRVSMLLSEHTAIRRDGSIIASTYTPQRATVTFGFAVAYRAPLQRTVCLIADGSALTWEFGTRPR